ncbi:hypothetical protein SBC1_72680 (plasmid) [Caballeronia sp. SBC1]|nr:hypothetical protein SBC2_74210 [Caballeronia sp. SBC2]QIN67221.1 hypothetical protein SBC1_72680 [Caballeronia sp. SBC1]
MARLSSYFCVAGSRSRDFHELSRGCALSCQLHRAIATSIVNQTNTFSPSIPTHVPAALLPSMVTSPLPPGTRFAGTAITDEVRAGDNLMIQTTMARARHIH